MAEEIFYHCKVLKKDFTREMWYKYIDEKRSKEIDTGKEIVYSERGFNFNIHDACLNKKVEEVWHVGKNSNFNYFRLKTYFLFGKWYCCIDCIDVQDDAIGGGCWGDYSADTEDKAKILALESLSKGFLESMKKACKDAIQHRLNELKFESRQLSLW